MSKHVDSKFMSRCLELSRRGLGWVSPNPMVGAVIVRDGKIIGEGFHRQVGQAHAEVEAIAACRQDTHGATLYVNLEPCNHHGRTPPCTEAIIRAGIARVVVGMVDPNPLVSGQGIVRLKQAGITVDVGLCEAECRALNRIFIHWVTTKKPFIAGKVAVSQDYKIAAAPGVRTQITGIETQKKVHELRQMYDAILVGVGTVLSDNPELTVRQYPQRPRDPLRIVLDSNLRIPLDANVLREKNVLVATTAAADARKRSILEARGITLLMTTGDAARVHLPDVLAWCERHGITSVLVEGGRQVFDAFVAAQLIQYWHVFMGPQMLGDGGVDALADLSPLMSCIKKSHSGIKLGPDTLYECPAR